MGVEGKDVTHGQSEDLVMDWMWGEGDKGGSLTETENTGERSRMEAEREKEFLLILFGPLM